MELAENLALDHKYDKNLGHRLRDPVESGGYHYINAKKLNFIDPGDDDDITDFEKYLSGIDRPPGDGRFAVGFSRLKLEANKYFSGIPVNTNMSVVHVPTNVFDGDPKVANAIDWSEGLDLTFKDNYKRDPSLSWQYFGSSTGKTSIIQCPSLGYDLLDGRIKNMHANFQAPSSLNLKKFT